jgi:peptidyl-prolyl cis-trans isomerase C
VKARASDAWMALRRGLFALARPLLREPLVQFVLVGALIFGVDRAVRRDGATIRITPSIRAQIARSLEVGLGRPPLGSELQAGLEGWKREQVLYREGVRMGLLDGDPVVRAHIASKLLRIARERDVLPAATDIELRDYLERRRSDYTVPATFDFEQVFISQAEGDARARAEQVLSRLRAGAPPEGLGDWFPRGNRFSHESLSEISVLLGEPAARELPEYAVGEWNVVPGLQGFHAVRITAVDRGEPDFERLRPALVLALEAERRDQAADAFAREIEGRYRFVDSE